MPSAEGNHSAFARNATIAPTVIARSAATKQSPSGCAPGWGLLRRCAPRNDREHPSSATDLQRAAQAQRIVNRAMHIAAGDRVADAVQLERAATRRRRKLRPPLQQRFERPSPRHWRNPRAAHRTIPSPARCRARSRSATPTAPSSHPSAHGGTSRPAGCRPAARAPACCRSSRARRSPRSACGRSCATDIPSPCRHIRRS